MNALPLAVELVLDVGQRLDRGVARAWSTRRLPELAASMMSFNAEPTTPPTPVPVPVVVGWVFGVEAFGSMYTKSPSVIGR